MKADAETETMMQNLIVSQGFQAIQRTRTAFTGSPTVQAVREELKREWERPPPPKPKSERRV